MGDSHLLPLRPDRHLPRHQARPGHHLHHPGQPTTAMTGHQPTPGVEYDILGNPTPAQDIEDVVRGMAGRSRCRSCGSIRAGTPPGDYRPAGKDHPGRRREGRHRRQGMRHHPHRGASRAEQRDQARHGGFLPARQHMNITTEVCRILPGMRRDRPAAPACQHIETDYGRKMDTDLTGCVNDGACERIGACPSFEQVTSTANAPPRSPNARTGPGQHPRAAATRPRRRTRGTATWPAWAAWASAWPRTSSSAPATRKATTSASWTKRAWPSATAASQPGRVHTSPASPSTAIIPYGKADLLAGHRHAGGRPRHGPQGRSRVASPRPHRRRHQHRQGPTIRGSMGQEDFDVERTGAGHPRQYTRGKTTSPATSRGSARSTWAPSSTPTS